MGGESRLEPSPWRDGRFIIFSAGNFVNNVGDAIYGMVLPLLVYDLTGSLQVMSLLAALVPATLLLGPLLGAVADRFGARLLVVPGLTAQLLAALGLNLTALAGEAPLWSLFLFGSLIQIGGAAYRQGWMAGIPRMFPGKAVRARGSLSSLFVLSTIVGPLIVAIGLRWTGYVELLWINLVTFVAPILVWTLGIRPSPPVRDPSDPGFHLVSEVAAGWRVLRAEPRVFRATFLLLPLEFVSSPAAITALVTFYLRERWQIAAGDVSSLFAAANLAAVVGSLLVSERRRFEIRPVLLATVLGMVASMLFMSLPLLPVLVVALLLFFLLDSALAAASDMLLVQFLPVETIGRSMGISRLLHGIPAVAAPLTIPFISAWVGPAATFAVLGLVGLPSLLWLLRTWRVWSDEGGQPPSGPLVGRGQEVKQASQPGRPTEGSRG